MRAFSPSVTKSVFRSVHPSLKVPPAIVGSSGGGCAFDPDLSGIQSRILDGGTIWTDEISSKYYLKDQSTDNTHLPRQGRAWLFDGSNDFGQAASLTTAFTGVVTLSLWLCPTTLADIGTYGCALIGDGDSGGNNAGLSVTLNRTFGSVNAAKLGLFVGSSGLTQNNTALTANQWVHICVVRSGSTGSWNYTYYINGVADGSFSSAVDPAASGVAFTVGRFGALANLYSPHKYRDIRVYNVAKTAGDVSAIYNQSRTGSGTFDTAGLLAAYPCNEESGTTGYDISGNGNHLTLTNITQATFHAADTGVLANRNNAEGYRLSGSVYIPKRLSSSLAADGNALTVTGRAAYHGCAETPCVTNHTGTVYIAAAHLTGSETVVSFSGSTTTPTISAGRIDWQSGQTLSDLTLSDGTRYTMQEGPGSGNTNRTIYNVNGSTNHGTLTNGTVATIWGTRLTGTAKDWCILYGGRIGAAGEFVPGRVSGSLAADGSAKTLVAGKFGNPFSRLNLNPATAAEFNGRSVPTAGEVGDLINGTITPDDTGFNRVDTDGDDRFLIYEDTLTGADLTNVENYVT